MCLNTYDPIGENAWLADMSRGGALGLCSGSVDGSRTLPRPWSVGYGHCSDGLVEGSIRSASSSDAVHPLSFFGLFVAEGFHWLEFDESTSRLPPVWSGFDANAISGSVIHLCSCNGIMILSSDVS